MTKFILAIDQGTTSSRAILFDREGRIRGCAQRELRQLFPRAGWVEHDANEIWSSQLAVIRQVLDETGVKAIDLGGIGIANQRETTILWDRTTGEPLAPAIVWQDRRAAPCCDALRAQAKDGIIQQKTGLVIDAYFSGPKLKWLLDNVPDARVKAERGELAFGTVDSWLIFKLSGEHLTDASNAARTMLFNINTLSWDDELLGLLDIPASTLPRVVASSEIVAFADAALLGAAVPIAGIAGDQQAATFGQACFERGMGKNTYGTGCFLLMHTGQHASSTHKKMLSTVGWTTRGNGDGPARLRTDYLLEGSVLMAGAAVQWLRDGLGIIEHSADVEALARTAQDNGGVAFIPAFTGLGAPYWDPDARGTIVGMTRGTHRGHIARATLESIALQSADVLKTMVEESGIGLTELRVDGGASRNDLLMQFQADVLGVPVLRPVVTETTALGAAFLAGLAVGFWGCREEISALWIAERYFEPKMGAGEREDRMGTWQRAVERARAWNRPMSRHS